VWRFESSLPHSSGGAEMHSPRTVQAALALGARGLNPTEVSRRLGVPRPTVRDWLAGKLPATGEPNPSACRVCGHEHPFDELPRAYVYLLGLYLGDGSIATHARAVYKLRISLDTKYPVIINEACGAVAAIRGRTPFVQKHANSNCVDVSSYWKSWPCLLPQHGAGRKHDRRIILTSWQRTLVERWPEQLLRGSIQSDGCRFQNTGRGNWKCPRYGFSNRSEDIKAIFCSACDLMGLRWTRAGSKTVYVSRKADVARLDEFIGPKR
jgi:Homeodomain-like domain